jgi:hypothetical protein
VRSAPRWTLLPATLGLAIVLAYLILWVEITPLMIAQADFTPTYVGATLFRDGLGAAIYDQTLQAHLYASAIAPLHEGYLPFMAAPLTAVVAAPVTLLSLDAAYRVWSLLQFSLIAVAAIVAVRAAPSEVAIGRERRAGVALIALACLGSGSTLFQGQWDGVWALGLAFTYMCLRRHRMATAGAVLAVTSLLAKPQLALGLAAFALGWRDRRLITGALAGGVVTVAVSLVAVGTGGVAGFLGGLGSAVSAPPAVMVSLVGIAASILGQTPAADVVTAIGSLIALAIAGALGSAVRSRPRRLEAALAGAVVLSLLASPHAFGDDLALLVPAAAWSITALEGQGGDVRSLRHAVLIIWLAISVAAYLVTVGTARQLGNLTPWTLVAAAGLAVAVCMRQGGAATVPSPVTGPGLLALTPTSPGGSRAVPAPPLSGLL